MSGGKQYPTSSDDSGGGLDVYEGIVSSSVLICLKEELDIALALTEFLLLRVCLFREVVGALELKSIFAEDSVRVFKLDERFRSGS